MPGNYSALTYHTNEHGASGSRSNAYLNCSQICGLHPPLPFSPLFRHGTPRYIVCTRRSCHAPIHQGKPQKQNIPLELHAIFPSIILAREPSEYPNNPIFRSCTFCCETVEPVTPQHLLASIIYRYGLHHAYRFVRTPYSVRYRTRTQLVPKHPSYRAGEEAPHAPHTRTHIVCICSGYL